MAATDKPLRDQNLMDIVFAASSVLMLVSVVLMFVQDYFREWKPEQRVFRQVESMLAQRLALQQVPSKEEMDAAKKSVDDAKELRNAKMPEVSELKKKLAVLEPDREKADMALLGVKADAESIQSLYYIAIEHHGAASEQAQKLRKQLDELNAKYATALAKRDAILAEMKAMQTQVDAADEPLNKAVGNLKKLNDKFDAMTTLAIKKEWTIYDSIRGWWIIDGFASPTKIQQITNNDYGINYNFKDVTRFDRCTTCHLGIDRPAYTKANLADLTRTNSSLADGLKDAKAVLYERKQILKGLPEAASVIDPERLKLGTMSSTTLTESRVNQFAAHPRLDLFVGATSKHPIEKFGCTTCHNGQGSSTSFVWASHSPNNTTQEEQWKKELGWVHIHSGDWEFPMNPQRFIESSCVKCHYNMTDLISSDNRNEAPKLLRGYNLLKDNGCFGCHEIAGRKGGREVGPDLRLESSPPLVDLTPAEQKRIENDIENRPGNMRKVGPSLFRIAEKTNEDFTIKWIRAPREFRPDTKMPHFYGVANNNPEALAGTGQEKFPDTEIHAVTHYLFKASNAYLGDIEKSNKDAADAQSKDNGIVIELVAKGKLSDDEKKTLDAAQRRIRLRSAKTLKDLSGDHKGDAGKGRQLFIERGCLSCHMHQATEKAGGKSPAIVSEAQFGPNLSQVAAKLGKKGDANSAKVWLVQWLLDPQVYNPRSRMPITQLSPEEATDIATWLLAQKATDFGPNWDTLTVPAPKSEDLIDLAKVYLKRVMSKSVLDSFFEKKEMEPTLARDLPTEERQLVETYKQEGDAALMHFVGKRGVGRLGCYACHDIPGFDAARPIGVGLNDWGKKDTSKLAYEDIANYFEKHYYPVPSLVDEKGKIAGPKVDEVEHNGHKEEVTRLPYEAFFAESLLHHGREGYLFQKLNEPRSFDYNRILAWDERSRMPQFRFARIRKNADETPQAFQARGLKAEAEAREAVMTFVLGLLAEAVPLKMINQPAGDRLAEVKGRQTLEAFNCGGCHLIRSGAFEIKPNEKLLKDLGDRAKKFKSKADEHTFPGHHYWTGQLPGPVESIPAHGVIRQPMDRGEDAEDDGKVRIRLTEAMRFKNDEGVQFDLPAGTPLQFSPGDFAFPPPAVLESPELTHKFLKDRGQYGGTFADLLVGYLIEKDPKAFPRDPGLGDSSKARPLVPPSLLGQGERTQPEWLYEFLKNPFPVRRMTILRMPKFSLSPADAQSLVDYFGAVERLSNPGIGLTFPFEDIKQQDAAADSYFKMKTAEYIERLKSAKAKDDGKDVTMYDKRLKELRPIWQAILKDAEAKKDATKAPLEAALAKFKEAETKEKDAQKKLDDAKAKKDDKAGIAAADADYKIAKAGLDAATKVKDAWEKEDSDLKDKIAANSVEKQEQRWKESDAYQIDAFKLVANKTLCWQCHQIGDLTVKNDVQGPPLGLAHKRLRPGWLERWIANPERHLPYGSSMPVNFPNDAPQNFQDIFAGTPADRVQASRDVLLTLPEVMRMPANKYWVLPLPGDAK